MTKVCYFDFAPLARALHIYSKYKPSVRANIIIFPRARLILHRGARARRRGTNYYLSGQTVKRLPHVFINRDLFIKGARAAQPPAYIYIYTQERKR